MDYLNQIDKATNIGYITNSNVSISKALMIFYLLVASNFTSNLFSKQMKGFFETNRLAQHFLGLITMLVIIIVIGNIQETKPAILYTFIAYLWFILTTKLDLQWNIVIILIMLFGLLYENHLMYQETNAKRDQALTDKDKENIVKKHNKYKTYIVLAILLTTFVGTALYTYRKYDQYGEKFDVISYFLY